uniref:Putative secreted protein n=1 Tax=Anopheles triannulatus TaxID=58253 RepID=A0A2M4B451_9DIPT
MYFAARFFLCRYVLMYRGVRGRHLAEHAHTHTAYRVACTATRRSARERSFILVSDLGERASLSEASLLWRLYLAVFCALFGRFHLPSSSSSSGIPCRTRCVFVCVRV